MEEEIKTQAPEADTAAAQQTAAKPARRRRAKTAEGKTAAKAKTAKAAKSASSAEKAASDTGDAAAPKAARKKTADTADWQPLPDAKPAAKRRGTSRRTAKTAETETFTVTNAAETAAPEKAVQPEAKTENAVPVSGPAPAEPKTAEEPKTAAEPKTEKPSAPAGAAESPKASKASKAPETPKTPEAPEAPEAPSAPETAEAPAQAEPPTPALPAPAAIAARPPKQEADKKAESAPQADEGPAADDAPQQELQPPPVDEKRLLDMTSTIQLNLKTILDQIEEPAAAPAAIDAPHEEEPHEAEPKAAAAVPETLGVRVGRSVARGVFGMVRWIMLVVLFVAVIAGVGVAYLYSGTTTDMIPQFTVSFAGQTLEPTAYDWKLPVISSIFKRTYAETVSTTASVLPDAVEDVMPELVVSPSDYDTSFTVTDSAGQEVYSGSVNVFNSSYQFTENGTYTGKLVVSSGGSAAASTGVTGSQTYLFAFDVELRPTFRLSSQSVEQGAVIAVRVGGLPDGVTPQLQSELESGGFVPSDSGWVCYVPVPCDAETGPSTMTVSAGSYSETFDVTIRTESWTTRDVTYYSQLTSPYLGLADTPTPVATLLSECDAEIGWRESGFVQPFLNSIKVTLSFGVTEFVGRTSTQIADNIWNGTARTATNVVLTTTYGAALIAPADGRVLLAEDLGGTAGTTLVIEHGAGLKSIFYGLQSVSVKAGDSVRQGQTVAATNSATIAEMRIGTVPIDPVSVWHGKNNGIKTY